MGNRVPLFLCSVCRSFHGKRSKTRKAGYVTFFSKKKVTEEKKARYAVAFSHTPTTDCGLISVSIGFSHLLPIQARSKRLRTARSGRDSGSGATAQAGRRPAVRGSGGVFPRCGKCDQSVKTLFRRKAGNVFADLIAFSRSRRRKRPPNETSGCRALSPAEGVSGGEEPPDKKHPALHPAVGRPPPPIKPRQRKRRATVPTRHVCRRVPLPGGRLLFLF